jgi:hypothetical protein
MACIDKKTINSNMNTSNEKIAVLNEMVTEKKNKLVNEIPKMKETKEISKSKEDLNNKRIKNEEAKKSTANKVQVTKINDEGNKKKKKNKKKPKAPEIIITDENLNTTGPEVVERKIEKKAKVKKEKSSPTNQTVVATDETKNVQTLKPDEKAAYKGSCFNINLANTFSD